LSNEVLVIKGYIQEMLEITRSFLENISNACKPHTLAQLIGEISATPSISIGGRREWYELIEEGRGLHGERLEVLSNNDCKALGQMLWNLALEIRKFFDQIGVGSMVRKAEAVFSFADRTRLKLEQEMIENIDSTERLTQDITAQTQGYTDRTKKSGAVSPLSYQIRSVYELSNTLTGLETLLDNYSSLGIRKPTFLIQKNIVIERLEKIGIQSVTPYIREGESKLQNNDFTGACHEARNALEEAAAMLANLITGKTAKRAFKDAINIFGDYKLLPADSVTALLAKNVGIYGWLSIKGGHAVGVSTGTPAKHFSEARYAINWTYSVVIMLVDTFFDYVSKRT